METSTENLTASSEPHPFRVAVEQRDIEGMMSWLSDDAELHPPITTGYYFKGHEDMRAIYELVFQKFEHLTYREEFGDGEKRFVLFNATIGAQQLEEAQLWTLNPDGKIREIRVFVRPLPGMIQMMLELAPQLAARKGAWRGLSMKLQLAPLAAMTKIGDKLSLRILGPPPGSGN